MEPNGIENFKPSEKCLQVNNTNKWGPWGSLYMGSARGKNILLPKILLSKLWCDYNKNDSVTLGE